MPDTPDHATAREDGTQPEPLRYPEEHVVGVLDTPDQLAEAANALIVGGFLDSEVDILCGRAAADRLKLTTGRGGWANLAMRIAERLGLENEEMEIKAEYEQALRDGKSVLRVAVPTDERAALAKQILTDHGASAVNYFGRYTIEAAVPPNAR